MQTYPGQVGAISYPGETGIIDPSFTRLGDVRRYGIYPDGAVVSGVTVTAGSTTVSAPVGTFNSAMAGISFASNGNATTVINSVAVDGSSLVLASPALVNWSGLAVVGTAWETQYPTRVNAMYANATLPGICIYFPAGIYNTGFNFTNTSSNTKMHFESGAILIGIFHMITTDGSIMNNCNITGLLQVTDRFGTISLQNSFVERVHVLNGTLLYGVTSPRGIHIDGGNVCNEFRELIIDGCSTQNGDGAFSCDDQSSINCKFGRVWVKDSDVGGVNIFGTGHTIDELIIDGWGAGVLTNGGIFSTNAQSMELAALTIARGPSTVINTLRINQQPNSVISCVTNATVILAGSGFVQKTRIGQTIAGTNIGTHSLPSTVTMNGSTAITGSGFSALTKGQPVSGTNIPSGVFLQSITSDAAAVLSNPATGSGTITMSAPAIVHAINSDTSITMSLAAIGSGTANLTFGRPEALYFLRVLETDIGGDQPSMATIGTLIAKNVGRRGLSIGDRNFPVNSGGTGETYLNLRSAEIQSAQAALDTGWQLFHIEQATNSTTSLIGCDLLRFEATYGNACFYGAPLTYIDVKLIDTTQVTLNGTGSLGTMIQYAGAGTIGSIQHYQSGGSGTPTPFQFNNSTALKVGQFYATAPGSPTITALDMSGMTDFSIDQLYLYGYRGTVVLVNGATRGRLQFDEIAEATNNGLGLRFQNNTDVRVFGGLITGMALGTSGSAGGNVRCAFYGVACVSNTTNTNLATGQVIADAACVNAQL